MSSHRKRAVAAAVSATALGAGAWLMGPASATTAAAPAAAPAKVAAAPSVHLASHGSHVRSARLETVNNSGARGSGRVSVAVSGTRLKVEIQAGGFLLNRPHAMHIHWGPNSKGLCPTVRQDRNRDHRLNVVEGVPMYGPVALALTTSGDTSPSSALAVARFPKAPRGLINYSRSEIPVSKALAAAITRGDAVVVVHGLDYNQNLSYDFRGAGRSELNPALPAEATDPNSCGVLMR